MQEETSCEYKHGDKSCVHIQGETSCGYTGIMESSHVPHYMSHVSRLYALRVALTYESCLSIYTGIPKYRYHISRDMFHMYRESYSFVNMLPVLVTPVLWGELDSIIYISHMIPYM